MINDMMNYLNEGENVENLTLDAADEAAIFLTALEDTCSPEEFDNLVMENATELELYGLIQNADIVTEAKKIVYKQTKSMNLSREQSKAAIRLAEKNNDAEYKKYKMHRQKMIESRNKIFAKYHGKAKMEAKKVITGAKRKASSMNSVTGKTIEEKMDKKIREMNKK